MNKNKLSIYIHIPFCQSKCIYCDFASFVETENCHKKYFDCLTRKIDTFENDDRIVRSVYFGGGTPSIVKPEYVEEVLKCLKKKFVFDKKCEISIECNPGSADEAKFLFYKKIGINRISFGVQSLDDQELMFLKRPHDANMAIETILKAKKVGFDNISADLLLGLPNSNEKKILDFCNKLFQIGVKHISAYMLQIEKGTPLFEKVYKKEVVLPNDDEVVDLYQKMVKYLKGLGFEQYEISNFAQKGYRCQHNQAYWEGQDYIGFGLGAVGCKNGTRYSNAKTFDKYYQGKREYEETLTSAQLIEERIMLGLRSCSGFSVSEIMGLGYNILENKKLQSFINKKILKLKGDKVFLNPKYYGVSNNIIVELFPN